jgi:hypothetical protein
MRGCLVLAFTLRQILQVSHNFFIHFTTVLMKDIEADVYVKNHYVSSNLHAMLICYVVASKPQRKLLADHDITRPSRGFNCVSP